MSDIRALEKQFKDFIEQAVSPHLFALSNLSSGAVLSTQEEDTSEGFDMRVGQYTTVSVRLRSNEFLRYRDFSLRSKTRFSGIRRSDGEIVKCELDRIREGCGNCYFYGWMDREKKNIVDYIIVDIDPFRPFLDSHQSEKPNGDGTSGRYYPLSLLRRCGALVFDAKGRCAA